MCMLDSWTLSNPFQIHFKFTRNPRTAITDRLIVERAIGPFPKTVSVPLFDWTVSKLIENDHHAVCRMCWALTLFTLEEIYCRAGEASGEILR